MPQITKRIVLHFPGFEPLDAEAHRDRYARSATQSARTWNCRIETGPLAYDLSGPGFKVEASGSDWRTESYVHIFDHHDVVVELTSKSLVSRIVNGYRSAARVAWHGGLVSYFSHAWRFGAFFVFPFLLVAMGFAALALLAFLPGPLGLSVWNLLWSAPLAALIFFKLFLPATERLHTLHLFADWELAEALACLDDATTHCLLEKYVVAARLAFKGAADEYLVTSHSMGSSVATHVIGKLLEQEPDIFANKSVVFTSLGSTLLQCALLKPAKVLRRRIGALARCRAIFWLDVQCLTDIVHFYNVKAVAASGFPGLPQARILFVRFKHMLTPKHYRTVKRDLLRMHRQYVLGAEQRAAYDFSLMTAGPFPARDFADFAPDRLAPLGADGAIAPSAPAAQSGALVCSANACSTPPILPLSAS